MKKSELKNIIKECVKEILFEEGILSSLVAEVAVGITKAQGQLLETHQAPKISNEEAQKQRTQSEKARKDKILETKKKMLNAIGGERMKGIFEGTEPLPNSSAPAHSPLAGQSPTDAGVDISGLFGLAGQKWQELK